MDQNPHIRIAAGGLVNVFDDSRLRMVQWDCDWNNPRLAGTQIVGTDEDSFAENGYVNGVLNLTQESVEIGTCAILGVAANGLENPIHRDEITGGLAEVQVHSQRGDTGSGGGVPRWCAASLWADIPECNKAYDG